MVRLPEPCRSVLPLSGRAVLLYTKCMMIETTMTDYQHQIDVMIAETLERLQELNPDRYALHYTELYTEQRNWNVAKLHQIEQDLITYAK